MASLKAHKKPACAKDKAVKQKGKPVAKSNAGGDSRGAVYDSLDALWQNELSGPDGRVGWYAKGEDYWKGQDASIEGVLGGFPETHSPDIRESRRFIGLLRRCGALAVPRRAGLALDCGAGIGRVTASLLRHEFGQVDLVEPNQRLLNKAMSDFEGDSRVRHFTCSALQSMKVADEDYDVIWAQWVLLYLPDDDLIAFFQRCQQMLVAGGLICVKENVVDPGGRFVIDREDNSISRTDEQYKAVFEKAGLRVVHELQQTCWPTHLIPVRMYALAPVAGGLLASADAASARPARGGKRPAAS